MLFTCYYSPNLPLASSPSAYVSPSAQKHAVQQQQSHEPHEQTVRSSLLRQQCPPLCQLVHPAPRHPGTRIPRSANEMYMDDLCKRVTDHALDGMCVPYPLKIVSLFLSLNHVFPLSHVDHSDA